MKYKILIKHPTANPSSNTVLWKEYGETVTTTKESTAVQTQTVTTYTPFETNDLTILKKTINMLDKIYGYENIMAVKMLEYKVSVDLENDTSDDDDIVLDDDIILDDTSQGAGGTPGSGAGTP